MSLAEPFGAACRSVEISQRAPLSARHALQAAAALDCLSDHAFAARNALALPALATAADILTFRATLRSAEPALGPLMDLMSAPPHGPHLLVLAAPVPEDGFASLPVADLMVSLYNQGTVPRLMLIRQDGPALLMQDLLTKALHWWEEQTAAI